MKLAHQTVAVGKPQQFLYILHGIFGSGRNWSSVGRRLVADRPEWGVQLVDLRQHGGSQGFEPPHTIAAAAHDIAELAQQLGEPPAAVLGHSFGGKVALTYAREHALGLQHLWLIDSTPDASSPRGTAWQMLQLIRDAPREFEERQDLIAYLSEHGIALSVGQWMATNLEQKDGLYRWRFDLDAIAALLDDFFREDLWNVIESPPGEVQIHVVKAKESGVLTPEAMRRLQAAAQSNLRVHYHEVSGGHWVNAENPEALLTLLGSEL